MKIHPFLLAAAMGVSVAAALAAPAEESAHGHSHSPNAGKKRAPRALPKNASARERALQARIDSTISALARQADEYWHKGDYEGVVFCNRMITRLDPQDLLAWSDMGWLLWAGLNREKEAEETYRQAVAANPNRHDMYYELGFYLYRRKRYHEAAATLAKAVKFPDADAVTWNVYAHALERMGRPERAAEAWREEQRRFPNAQHPQVNLARLKRKGLIK